MICADHWNLLLGADLENSPARDFGWKAVLASTQRPQQVSNAFKVPHHGSRNADHSDVWRVMLNRNCFAVVTPFGKLKTPLPTEADISRITKRTENAYCTTWPPAKKARRRRGATERIMEGVLKSRPTALNTNTGYVRLRLDLSSAEATPTIESFGTARKLSDL